MKIPASQGWASNVRGWNMRPLAWWDLPWSQKIVSTSLPSTWRPSWGPASAECLWQSDWKRRPSSLRHPEETSRKQVTWSTFSNLREDKETKIQNNNFHTHTEYYIHDCKYCWKQFEWFLQRLNLINYWQRLPSQCCGLANMARMPFWDYYPQSLPTSWQ